MSKTVQKLLLTNLHLSWGGVGWEMNLQQVVKILSDMARSAQTTHMFQLSTLWGWGQFTNYYLLVTARNLKSSEKIYRKSECPVISITFYVIYTASECICN